MKLILTLILSLNLFANTQTFNELADETFRKLPNTITLQVVPSTYELQWKKPRDLLFSLIKNKYYFPLTPSILGHVTTEINCTIDGERKNFFIGQSAKDLQAFQRYILGGYGFSILNNPSLYKDIPLLTVSGKLDKRDEFYKKIDDYISKDHFAAISFPVTEANCAKALDFAKTYTEKTKNSKVAGNIYGFGADPLKFEGAGCATMAESLLELAGLSTYANMYKRRVYLSDDLIGDPENSRPAGIWSLISSDLDMSIKPKEELRVFDFPDPQLIYDHIEKISSEGQVFHFNQSQSKLIIMK